MAIDKKPKPDTTSSSYHNIEIEDALKIKLSPNPVADQTMIVVDRLLTDVDLSIVSLNGQVIYQKHYNSLLKTELNTSDLNPGIYFVILRTNNCYTLSKLIK